MLPSTGRRVGVFEPLANNNPPNAGPGHSDTNSPPSSVLSLHQGTSGINILAMDFAGCVTRVQLQRQDRRLGLEGISGARPTVERNEQGAKEGDRAAPVLRLRGTGPRVKTFRPGHTRAKTPRRY